MKTENLQNMILDNQTAFLEEMHKSLKVYFDDSHDLSKYDPIIQRYARLQRALIPKQAENACAIETFLKQNRSCIANLDTGYGKTAISIAVSSASKYKSIYVIAPPHLVMKWAREIKVVLGNANFEYEVVIVKSYKDVLPLTTKGIKSEKKTYYIVSKNLNAKTANKQKIPLKRRLYSTNEQGSGFICPNCFTTIVTEGDVEKHLERKTMLKKCSACNMILARDTSHTLSPAQMIKRYGRTNAIDLLIIDEIHEEKSKETLRGMAFGYLIAKSKKVLGLTGTFLGGYASHAFYTLYRMYPQIFKQKLQYEWYDVKRFIKNYGGEETIYTVENYRGELIRKKSQSKERADLSPKLLDVLLPTVLYGKLSEIQYLDESKILPSYKEIAHCVNLDEEFFDEYKSYLEHIAARIKTDPTQELSYQLRYDALTLPDTPYYERVCRYKDNYKISHVIAYKPQVTRVEKPLSNKERKLLEIIMQSSKEGKKSIVYFDDVKSQLQNELKSIIMMHTDLVVASLSSSIKANEREKYIKQLKCDVLLINPELVKTGLDLIEYPTIVFYQQSYISFNVFTLRQAAKRAWRVGQTQACEVHTISYANTAQHKVLELIGSKINVSQGVEGKLSSGADMASKAEMQNIQIEIANAIINKNQFSGSEQSQTLCNVSSKRAWSSFESHYIKHLQRASA